MLAQLNHPVATQIVEAAGRSQSNIFFEKVEFSDDFIRENYIDRPEMLEQINKQISRVDFGVRSLEVVHARDGLQILFQHEGLAKLMPLIHESHGTRQFLKLFPLISYVLASGSIAIIDELDAAIHPTLLLEIISWFHDPVRNPHDAQLWASCHNVSLLEELSKEEIVFCEKNLNGRTEIYALNDVKGVRRDENYYKKYLGGVFGAVPRFG